MYVRISSSVTMPMCDALLCHIRKMILYTWNAHSYLLCSYYWPNLILKTERCTPGIQTLVFYTTLREIQWSMRNIIIRYPMKCRNFNGVKMVNHFLMLCPLVLIKYDCCAKCTTIIYAILQSFIHSCNYCSWRSNLTSCHTCTLSLKRTMWLNFVKYFLRVSYTYISIRM